MKKPRNLAELPVALDRYIRSFAVDLASSVIVSTPVDTGRARSNWFLTGKTGQPSSRPSFSEGSHGSTASSVTQAAIADINAAEKRLPSVEDTIIIQNPLPYISRLNAGSSGQAPSAFVQASVMKASNVYLSGKTMKW